MHSRLTMAPALQALLRCPCCREELTSSEDILSCTGCGTKFPVVEGVPVLLNEPSSIFTMKDVIGHRDTFFPDTRSGRFKAALRRFVPSLNWNLKATANYHRLGALLARRARRRVLVVGGSIVGTGLDALTGVELVESDIALGAGRVLLICDAHDIPFADGTFDGVVAQAVLEHVVDPQRCVDEMHRVLAPEGMIYSETPFMQQVHAGRYDFTRFTHLGHRRLFRRFEEIDSGAACGPGMALAWSYQYFLLSFARTHVARGVLKAFAALTSCWLRLFDRYLIDRPGTLDAASGYYFLGRKCQQVLADRDLIQTYRGAE